MGHVTDFKAVPGYGIECVVSNIGEMIVNSSKKQVIAQSDTNYGFAQIDGLASSSKLAVTDPRDIELQPLGGE